MERMGRVRKEVMIHLLLSPWFWMINPNQIY